MNTATSSRERRPPALHTSYRVTTISGIEVRVHLSFLVLLGLFALTSIGSTLWPIALFASVLLHEFAHSLTARRRGVPVLGIVLLPIGGISQLGRLPETPADEVAIAAVGPATSLGLGVVLAGIGAVSGLGVVTEIGVANLLLGGFNLLPAFPLDGGRICRGLLEGRMGLVPATQIAARLGRVIAVILGVVGLLYDIWLVLIAVFVWAGASMEEAATVAHVRLEGIRARDLTTSAVRVDPRVAAWTAATEAVDRGARFVVMSDRAGPLRVVSVHALLDAEADAPCGRLGSIADRVLAPDDPADPAVLDAFSGGVAAAVPVLDGDDLVGVVELRSVARVLAASS